MLFYVLIDEFSLLLAVNLDSVRPFRLPMGGENDNGLWLHFGGDFFADLLKLWIDRVVAVVHDVRLRMISTWQTFVKIWLGVAESSSNYLRRHGRRNRLVFYWAWPDVEDSWKTGLRNYFSG